MAGYTKSLYTFGPTSARARPSMASFSLYEILRGVLIVQISATATLILLSMADRRMRGMRWLAVTAALSVVAISVRLIKPQGDLSTHDVTVASLYSLCAVSNYLGMCHFATESQQPSVRWSMLGAAIDILCLVFGQARPQLASNMVRVVTLIALAITIRMMWRTPSRALRPTMRAAAIVQLLIIAVPICMIGFGLAGVAWDRNWMFSRVAVVVVITMMDFVFVAAYVAESKRRWFEGTRRDPLTNLRNRLAFDETCVKEIALASETRPLTLLMIDLDSFKKLNDTWGHVVGDRALRVVSEVMQSIVGAKAGCLARMGGEEFALLLPECDVAAAAEMAERLRSAVAAIRLPEARGVVQMTASIGVGFWERNDGDYLPMMRRADAALYAAKHSGRNQVVHYSASLLTSEATEVWPAPAQAAL